MQEIIDVVVVKVLVDDAVDAHQVLDNTVSHRESTVNLLASIMTICHLKCEITKSVN